MLPLVPDIEELSTEPVSSDSLIITWSPVPPTCHIQHYIVKHRLRERDQCQIVHEEFDSVISLNSSIELNNLEPYSTYEVEVEPVAETVANLDVVHMSTQTGEDGEYLCISSYQSASPIPSIFLTFNHIRIDVCHFTAPSKPPVDLSVDNNTRKHLLFTWDQPPCGDRNGVIIGYEYSLRSVKTDTFKRAGYTTDKSIEFREDNMLEDFVEYRFNISAKTSAGTGPSTAISVRTAEGGIYVHKIK